MDTYLKNRILYDPTTQLHKINGYRLKHTTWNEYQKLEALNPWEIKKPLRYSREHLVRLAGIKKGLYNPVLPTLRKISRDDVLCKLSDEHARHITCLDEEEFGSSSVYLKESDRKHFYPEYEDYDPDYLKRVEGFKNSFDSRSLSSFPRMKRHKSLLQMDENRVRNYNRPLSGTSRDNINDFNEFKKLYASYQNSTKPSHQALL